MHQADGRKIFYKTYFLFFPFSVTIITSPLLHLPNWLVISMLVQPNMSWEQVWSRRNDTVQSVSGRYLAPFWVRYLQISNGYGRENPRKEVGRTLDKSCAMMPTCKSVLRPARRWCRWSWPGRLKQEGTLSAQGNCKEAPPTVCRTARAGGAGSSSISRGRSGGRGRRGGTNIAPGLHSGLQARVTGGNLA